MDLDVSASLSYRVDPGCEVLLLLEAARSPDQSVLWETLSIAPDLPLARLDDPEDGQRRVVFRAPGEVTILYRAGVRVAARGPDLAGAGQAAIRELPGGALRYLRGSRYCPSDRFEGFAHQAFGRFSGGDKVQAILDWIAANLDYRAGVSDAKTTATETFIDRAGVCRDFTHLAITLCRASDIPARAVSAYAWGLDPPDMHAVAEVYVGGRWRLVDPTGKAPVDGLVRVATGLDAADIAFMTIFGRAELLSQQFSVSAAA